MNLGLLHLDLIIAAALGRTYLLRVAVALVAVLVLALSVGPSLWAGRSDAAQILGSGGTAFWWTVGIALAVVYLLTPLLVASHIPREQERGNLELLLTTPIRRWSLLAQGMAARLLVVASVLLVLAPLAALAYALGGVDANTLGCAFVTLVAFLLQVAAWSAYAGAKHHRLQRAIQVAYLQGCAVLFLLIPVMINMGGCAILLSLRSSNLMETTFTTPIAALWGARQGRLSPLQLAAALYPVWASVPIFLFMAKRALDQRLTDVPPEMAKKIKFMLPGARWLRNRRRQVIKQGLDATTLPTDDALAWRELRRVAPSNQRWLTTYWWALGASLCFAGIGLWISLANQSEHGLAIMGIPLFFSSIFICAAIVTSAPVIAYERAAASLAILATLPLTSRAILAGKLTAAQRMMDRTCLLILVCSAAQVLAWMLIPSITWRPLQLAALIAFLVALTRLAPWIGLVAGIQVGHPIQAMILAVLVLALWIGSPYIAFFLASMWFDIDTQAAMWQVVVGLSPLTGGIRAMQETGPDLAWVTSFFSVLLLWAGLRRFCLARADRILGRAC